MKRAVFAALAAIAALAAGCGGGGGGVGPEPPPFHPDPVEISVAGFPPLTIPQDNPTTRQGIVLGRRLFHDPILSQNDTQSCASCHAQEFSFSDHGRQFSEGIDGVFGTRNAPALINVGWNANFFVDGRAATLEDQALQPVVNPHEMAESWDHVVVKVAGTPAYPPLFAEAFGDSVVTRERVVKAIAQFERTFVSTNTRFDHYLDDPGSVTMTASELRGYNLFFTDPVGTVGGGDCFHCHSGGRLFTDNAFHNTGLDADPEPGRMAVTNNPADRGKYRTPTVRNLAFTAPYMHDGRFSTLEEVVRHYNNGGVPSETVDPLIRTGGRTLQLTEQDIQDLVAYLLTLTDSSYIADPQYGDTAP